jgi:putative IMPACT (imprinted ancient) family translation regulator
VLQLTNVVTDRGSKYAVSGGKVTSRKEADAFLKELKRNKKFAKATHNTWAVWMDDGTPLKSDDGESGAGSVILRMLEREELTDHIVGLCCTNRVLSELPLSPDGLSLRAL